MRVAYSCILLFVLVGSLHGKPAQDPTREEIDFVRPTRRNYNVPVINMGGEQPVVDTGYFPDSDFDLGSSWTSTFDDLFTRMRNQFASIFNSLPGFGGNGTGLSSGSSFGFPSFGNVDLSKGNTTSVTKVIDGHKVVINETTYNNNDDNGGTYFKVRIINVHPDDESTDQPKPEESGVNYNQPKDRETLESSAENEISKHKEDFSGLETFDEDPTLPALIPSHYGSEYDFPALVSSEQSFPYELPKLALPQRPSTQQLPSLTSPQRPPTYQLPKLVLPPRYNEWEKIHPVDEVDNDVSRYQYLEPSVPPANLANDIYVNQIMADAGAPPNPDAEFIDITRRQK